MIILPKEEYEHLTKCSEKKVLLQCDRCGHQNTTTYANYYKGQERRNFSGETYCRSCVCKTNGVKRRGKPAYNKGKKLDACQKGENHPSWKGGRYIDPHGYVMIYHPCENPKSKWEHYRKEHVVVVENAIGRELKEDEVVHHIDGDKQHNVLDNLHITNKHSGHRNIHQTLQEIGYKLIKSGLIWFNRDTEQYVMSTELEEILQRKNYAD